VQGASDTPKPRGRPPRISREQIVAAARAVPARDLTMQAVADALGVSRKALHYYVGDRQGLLSLVVVERFEAELARVELPAHGDWQSVLRSYAHAFRDGLIEVGVSLDHTPLRGAGATAALTLAERVLDVMLTAGFSPDDARRGLTALANVAQAAAQSTIRAAAGQHDYGAETVAALANAGDEGYPALRRALADASPTDGEQFDFELTVIIAGLETLVA
jgi:TetR/AcrR family transcriptional regulator, tetracycline repressor protein